MLIRKRELLTGMAALAFLPRGARADAFSDSPPAIPRPQDLAYYNFSPSSTMHWRKALVGVRQGTGRARLLFLGESTTAGVGGGTGGSFNENAAWDKTFPRSVGVQLAKAGVPVSDLSFYGDHHLNVTPAAYDPRIVQGTGWGVNAIPGFSGNMMQFTTGGGIAALAFTPGGAFDNFTVIYLKFNGNGSFTVDVDGGASLGTVNTNAGTVIATQNFSVAKATHTIHLNAQNNGNLFVGGIIAWDSTVPAVDLLQAGYSGANISTLATNGSGWSTPAVVPTIAPDLTFLCCTSNDKVQGTAPAAYVASLTSLVNICKASGDVILAPTMPQNTSQDTDGTVFIYENLVKQVAIATNCPVIDLQQIYTSYAVTNPVLPYFDGLHPGPILYNDMGAVIERGIQDPLFGN